MSVFLTNKIFLNKETVAEQLRSTRQEKDWKLADVAKKLKMNYKYLQALENGDFAKLPTGIYSLNFLRQYADFLELDYNKLRERFISEQEVYQSQKQEQLFARQMVSPKYFLAMPHLLRNFLILLVALACLIYLGWLLKNIFASPNLQVQSPKPELVAEQSQIMVAGKTDPETEVLINQVQTMVDKDGQFSQAVNLKQGINSIVITAQRGSRNTTVVREVLWENNQD